jgi:hypothetical protein
MLPQSHCHLEFGKQNENGNVQLFQVVARLPVSCPTDVFRNGASVLLGLIATHST